MVCDADEEFPAVVVPPVDPTSKVYVPFVPAPINTLPSDITSHVPPNSDATCEAVVFVVLIYTLPTGYIWLSNVDTLLSKSW